MCCAYVLEVKNYHFADVGAKLYIWYDNNNEVGFTVLLPLLNIGTSYADLINNLNTLFYLYAAYNWQQTVPSTFQINFS